MVSTPKVINNVVVKESTYLVTINHQRLTFPILAEPIKFKSPIFRGRVHDQNINKAKNPLSRPQTARVTCRYPTDPGKFSIVVNVSIFTMLYLQCGVTETTI